jgi:hypothetical protein
MYSTVNESESNSDSINDLVRTLAFKFTYPCDAVNVMKLFVL